MRWIVDTWMQDRHLMGARFAEAFARTGTPVHWARYVPFSDVQDYGPAEPGAAVVYGCTGYVQRAPAHLQPGAIVGVANIATHTVLEQLGDRMLNTHIEHAVWGDLDTLCDRMGADRVFVRPDCGWKLFPGFVLERGAGDTARAHLAHYTVQTDAPVLCSPVQSIAAEYRFVVVRSDVVASSQYRRDGVLDIRRDTDPIAHAMAESVAQGEWVPDVAYTCDVAVLPDGTPRVIELNSFSTAGWYACAPEPIISAINALETSHG